MKTKSKESDLIPAFDKYNPKVFPPRIKINKKKIPDDLKILPVWCCWKWEFKGKKWTKPPCDINGNTKSHLETNYTFKEVLKAYKNDKSIAGIGFSIRKEHEFCGIDIDNCIDEKGKIDKRALKIINKVESYCEISPSGRGIRIFGKGKPQTMGATGVCPVEIYKEGRYLTVTGLELAEYGLIDSPFELNNIEKQSNKIKNKISKGFYTKEKGKKDKLKDKEGNLQRKERERNESALYDGIDKIASSVNRIIQDYDCTSHDIWIQVGMAIKTEFEDRNDKYNDKRKLEERLDKGLYVWKTWSKTCSIKFDENECNKRWKSFNRREGNYITLDKLQKVLIYKPENAGFQDIALSNKDLRKSIEDIKAINYIIDPIFPERTYNLLHARRGLGKTHFALMLAISIANGVDFYNYNVPKPRKVLYFEGEMPKEQLSGYIRRAEKALGFEAGKNFILAPSYSFEKSRFPNFSKENGKGQLAYTIKKENPDIIFIDSLATIMQLAEDRQAEWKEIESWLIENKNHCTIVLIHHDNKEGTDQRGFSNKSDIANTQIHLLPVPGYTPELGACFYVNFSKGRDIYGNIAKKIVFRICKDERYFLINQHLNDPKAKTESKIVFYDYDDFLIKYIAEFFEAGETLQQIEDRFKNSIGKITHVNVATYRDKAVEQGILDRKKIVIGKTGNSKWHLQESGRIVIDKKTGKKEYKEYSKPNRRRKKEQLEAKKINENVRVYHSKKQEENEIKKKQRKIKEQSKQNMVGYYKHNIERIEKSLKNSYGNDSPGKILKLIKIGVEKSDIITALENVFHYSTEYNYVINNKKDVLFLHFAKHGDLKAFTGLCNVYHFNAKTRDNYLKRFKFGSEEKELIEQDIKKKNPVEEKVYKKMVKVVKMKKKTGKPE